MTAHGDIKLSVQSVILGERSESKDQVAKWRERSHSMVAGK